MKLFNLTAAVSVAFVSVLPTVCLSQSLGKGVKYTEVSSAYLPNCYVETTDHRILDLTSMCTVPKEADESSSDETAHRKTKASAQSRAATQSARRARACEQFDENCEEAAAARAAITPY